MTKFFYLFLLLLSNITCSADEQELCNCYYNSASADLIKGLLAEYKACTKQNFLEQPPTQYRKPNGKTQKELDYLTSISPPISVTVCYSDVYTNLLIFYKKLSIINESWNRSWHEDYDYRVKNWPHLKDKYDKNLIRDLTKQAKKYNTCKDKLYDCSAKILNEYINLFEECMKKHSIFITYHDYALFSYLNNNFDKSVELLALLLESAETNGQLAELEAQIYHQLGSVCIEAMAFDKAIEYLTESIRRNPKNKSVYFDRAVAYFETGAFDLAIEDYHCSNPKEKFNHLSKEASSQFKEALMQGLLEGGTEATLEFVPSLCHSLYGLGTDLWTTVAHPVDFTKNFVNCSNEVVNSLGEFYKTVDWNTVDDCVDQIKTLCMKFDQLNDAEKGQLIGYTIGKYGVDIYAGSLFFKGVAAYQSLKNANRLCNLEALAISNANKEALISASLRHAKEREAYFKRVRIEWDKQNKHILGKHNYREGNGIFEHNDAEGLLAKFAGKGQPLKNRIPGKPDFRERVDFGEFIGYYVNDLNPTVKIPTNKGTIRYSKKGAHIVPSHPDGK